MSKPCFVRVQLGLFLLLFFSMEANLNAEVNLSAKANQNSSERRFPVKSSGELDKPLSITSDKMVFQNLKDKIIFEGSVVIKNDGLLLESDRAEIFLTRVNSTIKEVGNQQQVSRIIASGRVRIKKGTQHARAEKGVYDRNKAVIVLTGNPELWEAGYRIKGKEITFFMDEEQTLVSQSEVVIQDTSGGFSPGIE